MMPVGIVIVLSDGSQRTIPLKAGSWSGSGFRAAVELDGERHVIHVDTVRT